MVGCSNGDLAVQLALGQGIAVRTIDRVYFLAVFFCCELLIDCLFQKAETLGGNFPSFTDSRLLFGL